MSVFGKLKEMRESRRQGRIARCLKTVKNFQAIKEDRWAAIDFFCRLGDAEAAVPALLQRFEYSLEHGIQDTREKELALDGIVGYGEAAIPFVHRHLAETTRIAWPIKVLNAIGREEMVISALEQSLNFGDVAFDQAQVDKNYDILCFLRDYKLGEFAPKITHFLHDTDERVRFAAAELLIEQDDEALAPYLEPFISDSTPDNSRIRQAVIDAFLRKHWKLKEPHKFEGGRVEGPLLISNAGTLELRP